MYPEEMFVGGLLIVMLFALLVGLAIAIMYYLTIQNTLKEVSPANRTIEPTNVWLMFIPIFNIVYGFIMYPKIAESLKAEFESRNAPQTGDYLKTLGIMMPILSIAGIIPVLGGLAGLANLVIWIIYWVKINEMKNLLRTTPKLEGSAKVATSADDLLDA